MVDLNNHEQTDLKESSTTTTTTTTTISTNNNNDELNNSEMIVSDNNNSGISDVQIDKNKKSRSIGVSTDSQDINLCEPGTNILLEGIVWNETNKGVLILNVTWRGKTFVGSLIDTNKVGWAPPR
jgi:hypothetical protein